MHPQIFIFRPTDFYKLPFREKLICDQKHSGVSLVSLPHVFISEHDDFANLCVFWLKLQCFRFLISQTADEMSFDLNPATDLNLSCKISARKGEGMKLRGKQGEMKSLVRVQ